MMQRKVEEMFPTKDIKVFHRDKEFMTEELHMLRKAKEREYRKNKQSQKYKRLKRKFIQTKRKNSERYLKEKVETLRKSNPASFFRKLKETGKRPGEENSSLTIQSHIDDNLTPKESADRIAKHFSEITKEIDPFDICSFPERV